MARIGSFDQDLSSLAWFDETGVVEGWFDDDLIGAAASGAYTLNADSGSYAISGTAATLLKNSIVDAVSGAYVISGTDATLLRNKVLPGDSGAYLIAGTDATIVYTPATGAYTLDADSGAYSIAGTDATFVYTSNAGAGGGVPWNPYRPSGETEQQKTARRIAQGIIQRAKEPQADIPALFEEAREVSAEIKADIAQIELDIQGLLALIDKRQTKLRLDALRKSQNDVLARRQMEAALIDLQLRAEAQAQQIEELDVVFMVVMLAAL